MNIAIFLPNWLGDLVMATPMLRAMRRHFGMEHRLIGILRPTWPTCWPGPTGSTSNGSSIRGQSGRSGVIGP